MSAQRLTQPAKPHWNSWYKTARWQKLRWSILVRDMFKCRLCGRTEGRSSQMVADHIVPHRGDEALFWDASNLAATCKPCHDSTKQSMEKGGKPKPTIGLDGWPVGTS